METEIFKLLAASGDIGIWVVLFVIWKLDRRVFKLETVIGRREDDG